ncbi:MAG: PAS domain-containing protein [Dysosmobacter sp.]
MQPINALDLSQPDDQAPYEELAPLLGKIRSQNRQIQKQMLDLKQRQEEFTAITENMSEGFLVIDQETRVLSYNSAALRLLHGAAPLERTGAGYGLCPQPGSRLPPLRGRRTGRPPQGRAAGKGRQLPSGDRQSCGAGRRHRRCRFGGAGRNGKGAAGESPAGVYRQRLP